MEYIVLDGAGDATADVLRRYNDSISYWRSAPDDGQYAAITEGFAMSTGEVLGWLNADDILLPRALFVVGEIFQQFPNIEWISTLRPGGLDANGALAHFGLLPGFNAQAFLDGFYLPGTAPKGFFIQQESTFFRRSLWERAGARIPPYPLAGDFALWCEFYKYAGLNAVAYPLGAFRTVEGQRSEDRTGYLKEGRTALEQARLLFNYDCSVPLPEAPVYTGHKVVNRNPKRANSGWELVTHEFSPMTDMSM